MDDLISRQEAIDALKRNKSLFCEKRVDFLMLSEKDKARVDEIDTCISELLDLPAVQPERKKGKWIKGVSENGVTTSLFCSECNLENRHWYEWNYCPNCGAEMVDEDTNVPTREDDET